MLDFQDAALTIHFGLKTVEGHSPHRSGHPICQNALDWRQHRRQPAVPLRIRRGLHGRPLAPRSERVCRKISEMAPTVQIPAHELLPFPALQTGQARLDCQRARPFLLELLEMQSSLRPQPPEEEWREILTVPALGRPSRHQQGPEERSFSFHSSRTKRQRGILRHPENTIRRSVS